MEEIETVTQQTPIEIALQVDAEGKTTAKRLYEFLKLENKNYSRWCKSNITDNEFAEETIDYEVFVIEEENPLGGRPTLDFKLTAEFAKKLAMASKSEKGEEARNYFIKVEDKLKETVIHTQELSPELQMFKQIFNKVAQQELTQKQQDKAIEQVKESVQSIRDVVALDTTSWREDTASILKKIGTSLGGGQQYSLVRSESYDLLSKRMGVNLKIRLTNKRRCMADNGVCRSKRDKLTYVDIIAEDKKLIEGYTAIVKEMAIKYNVA